MGKDRASNVITNIIKFFRFKTTKAELKNLNRNIFFSSKGHDAPALYSVLHAMNIISVKKILKLRRLRLR